MNNFSDMMQQQKQFLEFAKKYLTEIGNSMQCKHDLLNKKLADKIDEFGYDVTFKAEAMMATKETELAKQLKKVQKYIEYRYK